MQRALSLNHFALGQETQFSRERVAKPHPSFPSNAEIGARLGGAGGSGEHGAQHTGGPGSPQCRSSSEQQQAWEPSAAHVDAVCALQPQPYGGGSGCGDGEGGGTGIGGPAVATAYDAWVRMLQMPPGVGTLRAMRI
mmetsp:Transcript_19141/g.49030  ORF Transcript_19141/g.49030 Transcript_19141/m.49030 type:complete len:137 (-) Transcript_19141:905-1315(-)